MAFVVSDGALRAVERAAPPPLYSMRIGDTLSRDYAALWRAQPELRTVIDFLSRNVAQLGLHVYRRLSDVDRERLNDHALTELIDAPNPTTTRYRLIDALMHDLCIFDNAYWLKVRVDGRTLGVRRVRPQRIFPIGPDWLEPDQYEIVGTRGTLVVDATSVVHFRGYNPNDDRLGSPPIESLRQILSEEWAANIYREQLWRNGTRAGGYIQRPTDAPDWGTKGRERFQKEWDAQYTGSAATAGGTPILEDGMTFVPSSTTPRDAQYIESRKLTREEVARTYHVPLPMVGILDHATFSNIREQHKNLYQDCLGPWCETITEEIELQLLPDLPDNQGVYVEFNFAEKLRGSFEEQAIQLQAAVGGPWMTRNEARGRLNLRQIDGGDELIVPLNVVAGPDTGPEPSPNDDSDSDPKTRVPAVVPKAVTDAAAADLARYFKRQRQAVLSVLGARIKAGVHLAPALPEVLDLDRWDNELAADLLRIHARAALALGAGIPASLAASASVTAGAINATTADDLADALVVADPRAAVAALYDSYAAARAGQLAAALVDEAATHLQAN